MPVNADEVLKNVKVPLGGDLLGRERITGAKKTRLGCDSAAERFESIVEMPALWHAKQSFLGYIWEQLYKPTAASGRKDTGTLYHLRTVPTIVIAHTFCASPDTRISYRQC
ncbi:uncharacterized protein LOC141880857 [Acropora palmata]|uniref:uncharacterized protein LOC141880857 n=1 Tax=Acropora palmata TaxID=6131 RepID=UPI003DA12497